MIFRETGREGERQRETSIGCLLNVPEVCALDRNRTRDPSVHGTDALTTEQTGQGLARLLLQNVLWSDSSVCPQSPPTQSSRDRVERTVESQHPHTPTPTPTTITSKGASTCGNIPSKRPQFHVATCALCHALRWGARTPLLHLLFRNLGWGQELRSGRFGETFTPTYTYVLAAEPHRPGAGEGGWAPGSPDCPFIHLV